MQQKWSAMLSDLWEIGRSASLDGAKDARAKKPARGFFVISYACTYIRSSFLSDRLPVNYE